MTALDLAAIKARAELFASTGHTEGLKTLTDRCMATAADVPALVAEVERQAALIDAVRQLVFAASIPLGMTDAQFNAVIILKARDIVGRESSDSSSTGGEL